MNNVISPSGSIDEKEAFISVASDYHTLLTNSPDIILSRIEQNVRYLNPHVQDGALNKCRGSWYEWILNIMAWNYSINNQSPYILIQLPNVSSLDVYNLYRTEIHQVIVNYKNTLREQSLTLITSNPDFVLIKRNTSNIAYRVIQEINYESLTFLDGLYGNYINLCDLTDIVGFLSVKSSFRPDRRLQIINEGSLVKAIFDKIALTFNANNIEYPKYYAASNNCSRTDRAAFNNIALHSIGSNRPLKAVDDVFDTGNQGSINNMFRVIFAD